MLFMYGLPKTDDLIHSGRYAGSPQDFFSGFGAAYDAVRGQILKYEGRQEYNEPGNVSFDAFAKGDIDRAVALIRESKKDDEPIYQKLAEQRVEIVRLRSVKKPLSKYLIWEIENYKISEELGERIFFFNHDQLSEFLAANVHHDFMIFDARFAYMHDYGEDGTLKGGWRFDDVSSISALLSLFAFLKANSVNFRLCI